MIRLTLVFAFTVVLAGCGGGPDEEQADPALLAELRAHLVAQPMHAADYVVSKFDEHDVVFLGEVHRVKHDVEFVRDLIPHLHAHGVYYLGTEFGRREGFKGEQLTWWKWHLSRRSKKAAPPRRTQSRRKAKRARAKAARFVPVKLPASVSASALEIVLGNGRLVRVPTDCDGAWLAQVLAAADGE